jgi:two-component system cell cycle sensor histidine kinase PleC
MSITSDRRDRASAAEGSSAERRRAAARHMREARNRLAPSTGTRPAFDYELLRLFAQNRLAAALVILLLVGTLPGTDLRTSTARGALAFRAAVLIPASQ